jgi:putative IMPACT (imprinted ancient) family translation regulator
MLSILQHSKIGEIAAVVTRFFGGIKLGTGGLVRAYSSSVQLGLQKLPLKEYVALTSARITLPYSLEDRLRRLLKIMKIDIIDVNYKDHVVLSIKIPESLSMEMEEQIADQTMGQAKLIMTQSG